MISKDEYSRAIESFLIETQGAMSALSNADLKGLDDFNAELQESRNYIESEPLSDAKLIGTAFGILDEYVQATWDKIIEDGYNLYRSMRKGAANDEAADTDTNRGV